MYKYMSYELKDREKDASFCFYKEPSIPDEVKAYRPPVSIEELLGDMTLAKLHAIFRDIMKRQENRMDPVRSKFGNLKKEEIDLSGTMRFVQKYMRKRKSCLFSEILSLRPGKLYKIVTFLTLLQLMKEGKVEVTQEETFADIQIDWTGPEEDGEEMDLAQDYD